MITETDDIARALDIAAQRWPEVANERTVLLRRLIATSADELAATAGNAIAHKRQAIAEAAGSMTGLWPDGWLTELRNEWPE
jgi:allantoicase